MNREGLIQQVALHMDEITPGAVTIPVDGRDNNPLYELIDGLIDDAVLNLFSVAPYWRLTPTHFLASDTAIANENGRKVIRFKLGDDFLRIAEINCSGFQRPITELVPEQSDEGRRQHNRFLMGREAKPVGVLSSGVWDGEPCREIDCYSLADIPAEIVGSYIAKPEQITTDVDAIVPPVLRPALEWLIAAMTFTARGDTDHASVCQQSAQNLIV